MIPAGAANIDDAQEVQQPSRTYRLDFTNQNVVGMLDGIDAVKQFAYKTLLTERFKHFIYSFDYAAEIRALIGSSEMLLRAELPRLINEALIQDDRITGITDFELIQQGDSALVSFTVETIYGSYREEMSLRV